MSDSARIPKTRCVPGSSGHCPPQSRPPTMSYTQSDYHPEPSIAGPGGLPPPAKSLTHLLSLYDLDSDSDSDIDFDTFIQRRRSSKPQSKSIKRPVSQKTPQPQPTSLGSRILPTQVTMTTINKGPSKNMPDGEIDFVPPHPTDSECDSELDQPMSYTRKDVLAGGPSCMHGTKEVMASRVLRSREVLAGKRAKVRQESLLTPMAERKHVGQPAAPPPRQSRKEEPARKVGLGPASIAQPRQNTKEELYDPFGAAGSGPVGWLDQGEDVDKGTDDDDDADEDEDKDEDLLGDVAQSDPLIEKHMRANTKLSRSASQDPRQQPQPHTYRPAQAQNRSPGTQSLTSSQFQSPGKNTIDASNFFSAVSGVGSEVELSEQDFKIFQHTRGLHGVAPALVEKCYNDLVTRAKARKHPNKLRRLLPRPHIDQPAGEGQSRQGSRAKPASPSPSAVDNIYIGATGIREEWGVHKRGRQSTLRAHIPYSPQPATINGKAIDKAPRGGKERRAIIRGVQAAMRSSQLPIAESPTFEGEEVHIPDGSTLSPSPSARAKSVKTESAEAQRVAASNFLPPLKKMGRPARPRPEAEIDPETGEPVVPVPKRKGGSPKSSTPGVEAPTEGEMEREPVKTVVRSGSLAGSMFGGLGLTGSMFSGMGTGMGKAGALRPTCSAASAFARESADKLYPASASASQCTPSTNLRSAPSPYTSVPFAGPPTGSHSASATPRSAHVLLSQHTPSAALFSARATSPFASPYTPASGASIHVPVSQYVSSASLRSALSPYASASSAVASPSTALDTGPLHQTPSHLSSPYGSGSASATGSVYSPFGILNPQKVWKPVGITGKRPREQMRGDMGGQGRSGVLLTAEPAKKKIRRDTEKEEKKGGKDKSGKGKGKEGSGGGGA